MFRALFFLLSLSIFSFETHALEPGDKASSLKDALAGAYMFNPQLDAARAGARYTDDNYVQARAVWLPQISANITWNAWQGWKKEGIDLYTEQHYPVTESIVIRQLIYDLGVTSGRIKVAESQARAGHQVLADSEQSLLANAALLYAGISIKKKQLEALQNNLELAGVQDEVAQSSFDTGAISRSSLALANANLANIRAQLGSKNSEINRDLARFTSLTGLVIDENLRDFKKDLEIDVSQFLNMSEEELREVVINGNPSLKAAGHNLSTAEAGRQLAESTLVPARIDLTAQASWTQGLNLSPAVNSQNYLVQVSLNIPLYRGGISGSLRRQAQSNFERSQKGFDATLRDLFIQANSFKNEVIDSSAIIAASEVALEASNIAYEGIETEAFLGVRSQLDLLDARQKLLDAENRALLARLSDFNARVSLLKVLGRFTPDHLNLDVVPYSAEKMFEETKDKFGYFK